jgi:flagellar hook-associated protein 1 FlgK
MTGLAGFNTAVSGLSAAQRAIEVTAQNIANANTPGYSRQQVQLSSVGTTTSAHVYTGGNAAVLGGVQVDAILRVRDTFLETARVNAGATKESLGVRTSTLSRAEGLLHEPGDDGLQAVVDDFYASWHALAASPGTNRAAAAGQVLQAANTVVTQLKFVSSGIQEAWNDARGELTTSVTQLNQAASDLAQVNERIMEGTVADRPINELLDRRDMLVRTIGDLAGGRAVINKNNTVNVMVDNVTLVSGSRSLPLTLIGGNALAEATVDPEGDTTTGPPQLMSGEIGAPVSSGKIAGLLAVLGSDLPTMSAQLDNIAVSLRDAVNAVHSTGYDSEGDTGADFFAGTSASDLSVIPETANDLAVSSDVDVVDGSVAEAIADLALDDHAEAALDGRPGPSVLLRAMAADIGTKLQGLNRAVEVQDSVFANADAAVNSDSGVSIDEEMTSLLMYQRSYEASARVISAVDEILDTLINRMAV